MSIVSIPGFSVKSASILKGKGEESVGKIRVVLDAEKDEVVTAERHPAGRVIDDTEILGALNRHQSQHEQIAVQLRFGETDMIPVTGFTIGTITLSPGKGEDEHGKYKIILEAEKDAIRASDNDITSILGVLSMHNSTGEKISLKLRFV